MNTTSGLQNHIHHIHIFASNINESLNFYQKNFEGQIIFDAEVAGVRNVFMKIGQGRLHFYDQKPSHQGRGSIHHFGIQTNQINEMVQRLKNNDVCFNKGISEHGYFRYIMVPAPDNILIELFEVDINKIPKAMAEQLKGYFFDSV